jgi:hypothetical protein
VADGANDPRWIAADLLSQAEHDPTSQSILITDDADFADRVAAAVEALLGTLATAAVARTSWTSNGAIVLVPRIADAAALVDRLAPEHLEIATADPDALFAAIRHAGSVFLGRHTPEAVGDYVAGAEPCAADRAAGAFRVRAVGPGFHEADELHRARRSRVARDRPGGGDAGGGRRAAGACGVGRGPPGELRW